MRVRLLEVASARRTFEDQHLDVDLRAVPQKAQELPDPAGFVHPMERDLT